MCKGLEMKDDDTRRYTTMKLLEVDDPIAQTCICSHVETKDGSWDPAIASGLKGTRRDELARCFADLVARPGLPQRIDAVKSLAGIPAQAGRRVLASVAQTPGDAEVRIVYGRTSPDRLPELVQAIRQQLR